jgi:hypothetical protein
MSVADCSSGMSVTKQSPSQANRECALVLSIALTLCAGEVPVGLPAELLLACVLA